MVSLRKEWKKSGQLDAVKLFPSVSKAVGNELDRSTSDCPPANADGVTCSFASSDEPANSPDPSTGELAALVIIKNKIIVRCSRAPTSPPLIRIGGKADSAMAVQERGKQINKECQAYYVYYVLY